jgi:hypothetical protein
LKEPQHVRPEWARESSRPFRAGLFLTCLSRRVAPG